MHHVEMSCVMLRCHVPYVQTPYKQRTDTVRLRRLYVGCTVSVRKK